MNKNLFPHKACHPRKWHVAATTNDCQRSHPTHWMLHRITFSKAFIFSSSYLRRPCQRWIRDQTIAVICSMGGGSVSTNDDTPPPKRRSAETLFCPLQFLLLHSCSPAAHTDVLPSWIHPTRVNSQGFCEEAFIIGLLSLLRGPWGAASRLRWPAHRSTVRLRSSGLRSSIHHLVPSCHRGVQRAKIFTQRNSIPRNGHQDHENVTIIQTRKWNRVEILQLYKLSISLY